VWGSTARRVCPRVEFGCRSQRTASSSEKRAPSGKGVRGRGPNSWDFVRDFHGRNDVDNRYRGGKAMAPGRPTPGVRKGIAGAEVFARWKALQAVSLVVRSRGRLGGGLGGSHEPVTRERCESVGEATGVSEARRARITTGRQRPSRRSTRTTGTCSPPKRIALSWNRRLLDCTGAQALDAREPTMRGYWYEEVRWQKSVQRIARCDAR